MLLENGTASIKACICARLPSLYRYEYSMDVLTCLEASMQYVRNMRGFMSAGTCSYSPYLSSAPTELMHDSCSLMLVAPALVTQSRRQPMLDADTACSRRCYSTCCSREYRYHPLQLQACQRALLCGHSHSSITCTCFDEGSCGPAQS